MGNLETAKKINERLKNEVDSRLEFSYDTEDIYGQDYEEYGVSDIEETRNYKLVIWDKSGFGGTVLGEYIDINMTRLGDRLRNNLKGEGFSNEEIIKIKSIITGG